MTRFIVVRHGFSLANKALCFAGHFDTPLTDQGKAQAEYVARYLSQNEKVDHIFYSGLVRTKQTALPSAKCFGLALQVEKGLSEIFAGLWEALPYTVIDARYHDDWMHWIYDFSHARCTGGESVRDHYARVKNTVHRLAAAHEGQALLLFTHCTPGRMMNAMAAGLPPECVHLASAPMNASVSVFCYENGRLHAKEQNLIPYPAALGSSSEFPAPPQMPK